MRNASCPNETFFDSAEFMKLSSHFLSIFAIPTNIFAICIIYSKTPSRMEKMKSIMMVTHVSAAFNDFLIGTLVIPYIFFPLIVGKPLGFFDNLGVPVPACNYIFATCLAVTGSSIVLIFENRHNSLVSGRWKIRNRLTRRIFYSMNSIYPFIFPIPSIIKIPEQENTRMEMLKIVPCPTTEYFTIQPFVLVDDKTIVLIIFFITMLFYSIQFTIIFIHSLYHVFNFSSSKLSKKTHLLQKKFFISVSLQTFIPFIFVAMPIIYFTISMTTSHYNQALTNISYLFISIHGFFSSIATLLIYEPYRKYLLSMILSRTTLISQQPSILQVSVLTSRNI